MEKIYLDNAATTPMASEVVDTMIPFMREHYGNPSSTHSFGRKVKDAVETCRRNIAKHLNCSPSEICFTSGGTEADNLAIYTAVRKLNVEYIISSKIEHHAVLHCVEHVEKIGLAKVLWVDIEEDGSIDMNHLEDLLHKYENVLVSLMHGNNEIGNLLDLKKVGAMCKAHEAYFHSDTVQTMAHYRFDMADIEVDFITGSAHKFHGPKGIGFLYHRKNLGVIPLIHGGGQERNRRAGTENVYGIIGMTKALELAYDNLEEHQNHIIGLKKLMMEKLSEAIPEVSFNGRSGKDDSLYTVLNVNFPDSDIASMMLFRLDIEGIACSGGSACSSGSNKGSHVLAEIQTLNNGPSIRFSFSRYNTGTDIKSCVGKLAQLMTAEV
ncbi:MAG: cysteine desulfurase [Flavobacteriales bacterium]|nr:cysteine desulfurase [Flavobacteriales bacterium]